MSTITELINDTSSFIQKITILDIDDIYTNPLNKAPIVNVEDLAEVIKEEGLQTPLSVYKKENHHYVLINGERRLTALKQLGISEVPVIIQDKPKNVVEERLLILDANAQREETNVYKQLRAHEYEELYAQLKLEGSIPRGMLKIDWIGQRMNLSGRQVQRLLASNDGGKENNLKKEKPNLEIFEPIKKCMSEMLETKITFSGSKFSVSFEDYNDLNRILNILDIDKKIE